MRLGEATTDSQMMVRWSWLQKHVVGGEDDQERKRKGPKVQDQAVGSSNITTAMRKVI